MRRTAWIVALILVAQGLARDAVAQGRAQSEIVVPSFNVFSAGTTISVPDRGNALLGGLGEASDVRTESGPGFGRGLSSGRSASGAGVRVWVHDFQEMEEALARGRGGEGSKPIGFAARLQQYSSPPRESKEPTEPPPLATAKAKSNADGDNAFKLAHAADLLKRGQEAENRGKLKVAVLYYKSILSLGATPSEPVARQRLASLESTLASR